MKKPNTEWDGIRVRDFDEVTIYDAFMESAALDAHEESGVALIELPSSQSFAKTRCPDKKKGKKGVATSLRQGYARQADYTENTDLKKESSF